MNYGQASHFLLCRDLGKGEYQLFSREKEQFKDYLITDLEKAHKKAIKSFIAFDSVQNTP
ncbi:MAG: hypothetical protein SPI35_04510 [Porphyromonas sp.]|nr:hypothetical protein [Porphyromonas sp.]